MSRESAKARFDREPNDPAKGYLRATDAQAAVDDIYNDLEAVQDDSLSLTDGGQVDGPVTLAGAVTIPGYGLGMYLAGDGAGTLRWQHVPKGDTGPEGPSAYEVALSEGFVGTEAEWLESLRSTLPGPTGPTGEKGDQGDQGDPGPTTSLTASATTLNAGESATATISGTPPNLALALGIPQGVPGALGAFQAKTAAYTILGTDGTVSVDTTSGAVTLTLPGAAANSGKWLRIIKTGGTNTLTVQRAGSDTISPSSGTRTSVAFPAATFGELVLVSFGTSWHVISGQASDESVGRRLWKWEQALAATSTTAATGWQMVYGDTGWRDITATQTWPWSSNASVMVRRVGQTASYRLRGAQPSALASSTVSAAIPSGFRPDAIAEIMMNRGVNDEAALVTITTSGDFILTKGATLGSTAYAIFQASCGASTWPSSLPGTVSGSIPTFA